MMADFPIHTPPDIRTQAIYDNLRLEVKPIVDWRNLLDSTNIASVSNIGIPLGQQLYIAYAIEHPDQPLTKPFPADLKERLDQQMRFVAMAKSQIEGIETFISREGLNDILVAAERDGNPDLVDLMLDELNLNPVTIRLKH